MGELLQGRHRQHGLSSARQLHGSAVASVVALQAQSQAAAQGRELSTLAPVRALRARTLEQAWTRRVVDEGVRSCPRAGCGRSASDEVLKFRIVSHIASVQIANVGDVEGHALSVARQEGLAFLSDGSVGAAVLTATT